jgi:hypothetical protein
MSSNNYDNSARGGQAGDPTQRIPQASMGGYDPNQPLGYPDQTRDGYGTPVQRVKPEGGQVGFDDQTKDGYGTPVKPYPGTPVQSLPPTPVAPIQPYQQQYPQPYQQQGALSQVDIDRVRADAAKAVKDRQGFRAHLTSYIFVIGLLTAIWLITVVTTGNFLYFWPVWPAFGWGIGLFAHYLSVYGGWANQNAADQQRQIDEEVNRRLGR